MCATLSLPFPRLVSKPPPSDFTVTTTPTNLPANEAGVSVTIFCVPPHTTITPTQKEHQTGLDSYAAVLFLLPIASLRFTMAAAARAALSTVVCRAATTTTMLASAASRAVAARAAGVTLAGHCGRQHSSSSSTPAAAPAAAAAALECVTILAADSGDAVAFWQDALGFKPMYTRAQLTEASVTCGDPAGVCVCLLTAPNAGTPAEALALEPRVTVAVSNLTTAARQAVRRGGAVVEAPGGRGRGVDDATFYDGGGAVVDVLHLFRRYPIVSLRLACRDVGASADFYRRVLGLSQAPLTPTAAADAFLPPDAAAGGVALLTCVAGGANAPSPSSTPAPDFPILLHPAPHRARAPHPPRTVLRFRVASAAAAHAAAAGAGAAPAPVDIVVGDGGAADAWFLATDPDGHLLEIVSTAPVSA